MRFEPRPLHTGLSEDEVDATCLERSAERLAAAHRTVFLGLGLAAALQWNHPESVWLIACIGLRLASLVFTQWLFADARRRGALAAVRAGLDRRLAVGSAVSGVAWGLLMRLVGRIGYWQMRDELTVILIAVVAVAMLITLSYQWRSIVAFNTGLWGTVLLDVVTRPRPIAWIIFAAVVVVAAALLIYGRQLHQQARDGVVADLENRRLARELADTNERLTASLREATALSRRDPLTRAYNRRAFMEHVRVHAALMRRQRESACVLMLDLDHFKRINDQHGHAIGDAVLEAVSAQLRADLREIDVLARWGGEEFVILLPNSDGQAGRLVADRIRKRLDALPVPSAPAHLAVSASVGVALWPHDGTFSDAIRAADQALYRAKEAGRNRVEVAGAATAPASHSPSVPAAPRPRTAA